MVAALARRSRLGALLLALVVLARPAAAQDARRVEVVVAAAPAVAETVLRAVRDSLAQRGLAVDATAAPRIDPMQLVQSSVDDRPVGLVARVWLDLVAPQPTMYLVTEPSGLVYVRPLAVHAAPDNVELELIRFVVDGAVQAILEGQPLGVSRAEFKRSLAPPVAPAAPPRSPVPSAVHARPRWMLGAEYGGARLSPGIIAHGPGLTAELQWPRLRLGLVVLQRLPVAVNAPDEGATSQAAGATLVSSGVRLFAAVPAKLTARLSVSVGLGAGLDVTRVAPSGTGATPAFWVTDPLVLGIATAQHAFGRVVAALDAGAELDLITPRYAVIRPGQTFAVWTPERWRPFVVARLGILF